ncbi:MAG: hypothetical protein ACYDBJ_08040 [Aggregatilineales bacterium]
MDTISEFVLSALRHQGALIEDAGFGLHECLLPEMLASQLGVPAFITLSFGDEELPDTVRLYYGHPAVEALIGLCRTSSAFAHLYANHIRLDKRGLENIARNTFNLPKGRLISGPDSFEIRQVFHYVRFNFRATFISDEKHEVLTSVVLLAQTGQSMSHSEQVERLMSLQTTPDWKGLSAAPLRWLKSAQPDSEACLNGLLDRAVTAATEQLAPSLIPLQQHAARYLELDSARLKAYYGELQTDLEKRLARTEDPHKVQDIQQKILTVEAELRSKLSDIAAKHDLRTTLELLNFAIIEQPKVVLPLLIEQRKNRIPALVVWDPIRHQLEPLLYDEALLLNS